MNPAWSLVNRILGMSALLIAPFFNTGCSSDLSHLPGTIKDDAKQLPGNLWQDSRQYVSSKENLAILLVGGGASGYYRCAEDDRVANHFEDHHTFSRDFTIAVGAIPLTELSLTGVGYLYGLSAQKNETYQVSRAMLEAQILNGIFTETLKLIAQDRSPNGENLAWPSGHTSVSVTFATVLNEFYGPWVGLPLYVLSGLVTYQRMETGEHWASDVIFGAAIGYTVGKTVAGKYKPEIFGMDVVPYVNPEARSSGVALVKQF